MDLFLRTSLCNLSMPACSHQRERTAMTKKSRQHPTTKPSPRPRDEACRENKRGDLCRAEHTATAAKTSIIPLIVILLILPLHAIAQSGRLTTAPITTAAADNNRSAQSLYDEANTYIEKKYEEFNQKKLPFDPKLEAATRQAQRDLAARNAATILARENLAAADFYYLGM